MFPRQTSFKDWIWNLIISITTDLKLGRLFRWNQTKNGLPCQKRDSISCRPKNKLSFDKAESKWGTGARYTRLIRIVKLSWLAFVQSYQKLPSQTVLIFFQMFDRLNTTYFFISIEISILKLYIILCHFGLIKLSMHLSSAIKTLLSSAVGGNIPYNFTV